MTSEEVTSKMQEPSESNNKKEHGYFSRKAPSVNFDNGFRTQINASTLEDRHG